ncbi:hypothetical protein CTAYLR_007231 [Chrysophaeum taylorii]|uniref:GYF domain-containing protein n=1 Tax=Chrysophaeum taylorii TaxID=2483200 RepID=A0AAD7XK47_9STRA|nr:hypothetical protein CTAYLR_007231 [Chrysophaeum taylorii]
MLLLLLLLLQLVAASVKDPYIPTPGSALCQSDDPVSTTPPYAAGNGYDAPPRPESSPQPTRYETGDPGAEDVRRGPSSSAGEHLFVRDGRGVLYGPYVPEQAYAIAASNEAEVVCLDARPVEVGRAVEAAVVVSWFLRCPDGLLRGPFEVETLRRWLVARQLPPSALAYAGRRAPPPDPAYAEPPSNDNNHQDVWKSTWRKHLRPHRWRATRAINKLGKSAAKKSVEAVVSSPIIKTWADEEAEWAALVTKAHAHRPPITSRPPPSTGTPERRSARPPSRPPARAQQFRAVDASKRVDPSAAWRDDARLLRNKRLKKLLVVATAVAIAFAIVVVLLSGPLGHDILEATVSTVERALAFLDGSVERADISRWFAERRRQATTFRDQLRLYLPAALSQLSPSSSSPAPVVGRTGGDRTTSTPPVETQPAFGGDARVPATNADLS